MGQGWNFRKYFNGSLLMLLVLVLVFTSCGGSSVINLRSSPPKSDIYIKKINGTFKKVGTTPMTLKAEDIAEKYQIAGPFILEFRKDGYHLINTLVTELNAVDMDLSMELPPITGVGSAERLDEIVGMLFEVQRLINGSRFDEASKVLDELEKIVPHLSVTHEFRGGLFTLQRKYKEALSAFENAYRLNPKNKEALRMLNYVRQVLGINGVMRNDRAPASKNTNTKK
jgi:tetratricopeptide (TPR) repeat protein